MTTDPQPGTASGQPLDRQGLRAYVHGLTGDQVNDLLQQSASPTDARAVLNAATRAQIQHVADLNYIDDQRTRTAITRDLLTDRYPNQAAVSHDHPAAEADQTDQADQADSIEDLIEVSWTEHVLQDDGTWQHTQTVTQQVPASAVHDWSDQDDDAMCDTADEWPYGDGLDLGDEL
jgi:hypothetical protein